MITVGWEQEEEAFIVRKDGEFIRDYFDAYDALKEAACLTTDISSLEDRFEVIAIGMF